MQLQRTAVGEKRIVEEYEDGLGASAGCEPAGKQLTGGARYSV